MRRTLLLTHEYHPYRGGIARYCYNLFRYAPRGSYWVLTDQKQIPADEQVTRSLLVSTFMRPSWLRGVHVVQKFVKHHNIDIIVTPHILPLGNIALYVKRLSGVPYVISLHGLDINTALERKRKQTLAILKEAEHIIANSTSTANVVKETGVSTPLTIITPSLDTTGFEVDERVRRELLSRFGTKKILLTVGRLVKRKGQDVVIRAMPDVVRHMPDAQYVIVGDGPDYGYLEDLIETERMRKHVTILRSVDDKALPAYYSIASVFAMPARKIGPDVEGFGIVYLEAAYFGLPIIAGRSGGELDAIGNGANGLMLDGENVAEISEAILSLLQDRELSLFLGANAKKHAAELPTWSDQSRTFQKLLA